MAATSNMLVTTFIVSEFEFRPKPLSRGQRDLKITSQHEDSNLYSFTQTD